MPLQLRGQAYDLWLQVILAYQSMTGNATKLPVDTHATNDRYESTPVINGIALFVRKVPLCGHVNYVELF